MRALANQRGSALLIALALMALLTVVAITALDRSTTDVDMSYNQLHDDQAFYIAEAGINRACAELSNDLSWRSGFTCVAFNDGQYTVTLDDSTTNASLADTVVVTSMAERNGASSGIEVYMVPIIFRPFQYALFGDSSVDMRNSALTDSYNSDSGTYAGTVLFDYGDIGSNGTIDAANGAMLGGDVATATEGGLSINPGATVAGDTTSTAPEQELPLIPDEVWAEVAVVNDNATGISGSYTYNPSTHSFLTSGTVIFQTGTYFFSSVELKNTASLELAPGAVVTIYVTGDIELKNSSQVNLDGSPMDLQFYSQGDIVLKNSGDIFATFYSPDGFGDLRNSGDFYGSIVAEDILVHNSAGFHFDRHLLDIEWPSISGMMVVAWREI
ncbi:MAG: PilX N-terminal domain-containing pilus assembly protein [Candidatus Zixiibacteriota bacterium]